MPVSNLKTRDIFYVVRFALDKRGRSITLDPRCFPSGRAVVSIEQTKQNELEPLLVRSGNFVLEYDMAFLAYFLRREKVQWYAVDEVSEVENAESA